MRVKLDLLVMLHGDHNGNRTYDGAELPDGRYVIDVLGELRIVSPGEIKTVYGPHVKEASDNCDEPKQGRWE